MLRVDVQSLATAAATVTGHGEDLAVRHLTADNRIAAAAPGWAGRSATALENRTARWLSDSAALLTRVGEHAAQLSSRAACFAAMDADNGTLLGS